MENLYEYDENIRKNEKECQENNTYLGFVMFPDETGEFLLDIRLDNKVFYKFNYNMIKEYGKQPIHPEHTQFGELEIVQVHIINQRYTVVIKTFWLRLLQRRWKRYMNEYRSWIQQIKKNILKNIMKIGLLPTAPNCYGILQS